jgi:two-component system sensor histidine kinase HydH
MPANRSRGTIRLSLTIVIIVAGAALLSILFYASWQRVDRKVTVILQEQFNQQQLTLARKIADNVESYFDYLENELLSYPNVFRNIQPDSKAFKAFMADRVKVLDHMGVVQVRRYNEAGVLEYAWGQMTDRTPIGRVKLAAPALQWVQNPDNQGHLFLGETRRWTEPPFQGRLLMPFVSQVYRTDDAPRPFGALELLIDPSFICGRVTKGVRSGKSGYAWIVDQNGILLAHYEHEFVGKEAIQVRQARNPKISFKQLEQIQARLLSGEEGKGEYTSGWHRQRIGIIPKLVAFTPIHFTRGLIQGVTEVEDPRHNMWGVAVTAPVAEVSGDVAAVLHQELFLVGLFFLVVLGASGAFIGTAFFWNKSLSRQVELKTEELLESHERLLRSERFAAVGEAAAYVSHEIKNPLMVIGGLANQVERHLPEDPASQEKLRIIQNEVKRLESFLGELRDFLRPVQPCRQEIDLNQVIQEVKALMGDAMAEKGVRLVDRLDPNLPPIEADPNQIKQVLLNLVKNALEATEGKGEIFLSSGFRNAQVWFAVQDMGKGMPDDVLEKIFHPFYTTKDKGTGLGLAVINKIVTDHHGTITVDSVAGSGSTFTVRLPKKGADAA